MGSVNYEDLRVWKEAMALAKAVYRVTGLLPKEEQYGLSMQMRRSAVSIASNIAEGAGRNRDTKEFNQFLGMAAGSLAELRTQMLIAVEVFDNLAVALHEPLQQANEIGKMLQGLRRSLAAPRITKNEQRKTSNV